MNQHYNNYYYIQHNLPQYTQFYDFCQQYYISQQMWNTHTFSLIKYAMPKEQVHQITPLKTGQVKIQQIDENFQIQKNTQKLTTDCMFAKQSQIQKISPQISFKKSSQQKQNRNVYSNILRSFFRKLHDTSKIKEILKVIIKKKNLNTTAENFIKYLRKLKIDHGKYLRVKRLKNHFNNQRLKQHAMVLRILFEHYRKEQLLIQTLTSKKISKWSVKLHLKGARDLKNKIFC